MSGQWRGTRGGVLAAGVCGLVVGSAAGPASADGKVFGSVLVDASDPLVMPDQRAILGFDGSTQVLAIDTAFARSDGSPVSDDDELAWLVPLPGAGGVPVVGAIDPGAFESAAALTTPTVRSTGDAFNWGFIAGILALLMLICLDGPAETRARRTGVVAVVVATVLAGLAFLPALGKPRSLGAGAQSVEVLSRDRVGVYDTAILSGERADAVLGWLEQHGFAHSPGIGPAVQGYLDRGWVFAAARLALESSSALDAASAGAHPRPHPLAFTFRTDRPVYPMALTAVDNGPIDLELFVIAAQRASAPGMAVRGCRWVAAWTDGQRGVYEESAVLPVDRSDLGPMVAAVIDAQRPAIADTVSPVPPAVLTRLRGTLSPEQQRSDLSLAFGPFREHVRTVWTPAARRELLLVSAVCGTAVGVATLLAWALVRRAARVPWAAWLVPLGLAGAGTVWAATVSEVSPGATRFVNERHAMMALRSGVGWELTYWAADTEKQNGIRPTLVKLRAELDRMLDERAADGRVRFRVGRGPLECVLEERPDGSVWFGSFDGLGNPRWERVVGE